MMWLVSVTGVAAFVGLARKAGEARWLAVICATVWFGYNLFLLVVYLGVMSRSDAEMAADYWRCAPHVALLGLYVPAVALALERWLAWMRLRGLTATAAVVLLALCVMPVRSHINNPRGRALQPLFQAAAADLRQVMLPASKLLTVHVWSGGPFAVAVRYHLWQHGMRSVM